jgi:hypothetical protein
MFGQYITNNEIIEALVKNKDDSDLSSLGSIGLQLSKLASSDLVMISSS